MSKCISIIDRIALDNIGILKSANVGYDDCDEARLVLSSMIDTSDSIAEKLASSMLPIIRISQGHNLEVHQDDEVPDIWKVKKGKIVRVTSQFIKR